MKIKKPEDVVRVVKAYLDENITTGVNTKELNKLVNVSMNQMNNNFKDCYGLTPFQYFLQERLRHLIDNRHRYIEFDSLSYFAKAMGYRTGKGMTEDIERRLGLTVYEFVNSEHLDYNYTIGNYESTGAKKGIEGRARIAEQFGTKRYQFIVDEMVKRIRYDNIPGRCKPSVMKVQHYCNIMGYEQSTCAKAFRLILGKNIKDVITDIRFEAVLRDVKAYPISHTCFWRRWGYLSHSGFQSFIKRYTGKSVQEFCLLNRAEV